MDRNSSGIAKPCMICSNLFGPAELEQHENSCFDKIQAKHDLDQASRQNLDEEKDDVSEILLKDNDKATDTDKVEVNGSPEVGQEKHPDIETKTNSVSTTRQPTEEPLLSRTKSESDAHKTTDEGVPLRTEKSESSTQSSSFTDTSPDKDGQKFEPPSQLRKITLEHVTNSDKENVNQLVESKNESPQHDLKGEPDRSIVENNPAVSESAENIDLQKSILESTPYPDPIQVKKVSEGKLPGRSGYKDPLPELSRANEAAYQAHLNSLVPCSFCGRRFTADRVMVHEGACIERPKKRTYVTPDKNNLK